MISIVVCTYNRSALLRSCLQSILAQTVPIELFEVIVVDNNSIDDTLSVAQGYSSSFPSFTVLQEKVQGLSYARNCGWRAASGEYIAFIDDDAKAPVSWIAVLVDIIKAHHPDVVGGPIYPFYTTEKPNWFKDEYEIRVHQSSTGWMTTGYISGSNLIIRKQVLQELGGFDTRYGMLGTHLAYGEDTEIVLKARRKGKSIYYSHDLYVYHHVPARKMDILHALNTAFRKGYTAHSLWKGRAGPLQFVKLQTRLVSLFTNLDIAVSGIGVDTEKYPYRENYVYEICLKDIYRLGVISGKLQPFIESARSMIDRINTTSKRLQSFLRL